MSIITGNYVEYQRSSFPHVTGVIELSSPQRQAQRSWWDSKAHARNGRTYQKPNIPTVPIQTLQIPTDINTFSKTLSTTQDCSIWKLTSSANKWMNVNSLPYTVDSDSLQVQHNKSLASVSWSTWETYTHQSHASQQSSQSLLSIPASVYFIACLLRISFTHNFRINFVDSGIGRPREHW